MKKGNKYMNKNGVNKVITPDMFQEYLDNGWVFGNTTASHKGMTAWNKGLTKDTDERVKKISNSKVGILRNEVTKQKLSNANRGKKLSAETKLKISQSKKGHTVSQETKDKISNTLKGHEVSESTRKKIGLKSNGRTWTEQQKSNHSIRLKGRIMSEKQKKHLSDLHKSKEFQIKLNNTKRNNNTFNTSNAEEQYYLYLVSVYGKENIIRQYRDDRYPFSCDFYIKSEDKFIELNLHWTHGGHPYNKNCQQDAERKLFLELKSKTSNYYKNALYVWTDLDVRKQNIAKANHLNYEVIYKV